MKDKSGDDELLPTLIEQPASEAEREAAWEAFKAVQNAGWTSEGRKLTRDEMHARGKWWEEPGVPHRGDLEQD